MPWRYPDYEITPEEDAVLTEAAENDPDNPPLRDGAKLYTPEEYRKRYGRLFLSTEEEAA